MTAIERIMKAYASKHELNPEQAAFVQLELSAFINELMSANEDIPTMLPETGKGAAYRYPQLGTVTDNLA